MRIPIIDPPHDLPRFAVWCPDLGHTEEDAERFAAFDCDDAARNWGEWYDRDSDDYPIANGSELQVLVRECGSSEPPRRYAVTAELLPRYRAAEAK